MLEEVQKLEKALAFYSESDNYEERYDHVPYGATTAAMPCGSLINEDGGATARAALGIPEPAPLEYPRDTPGYEDGLCPCCQKSDGTHHPACGNQNPVRPT